MILLVEDYDELRFALLEFLQTLGYHVQAVPSAEAATPYLEGAADGEVELLITDVMLPGISGLTLAARFRRQHPRTPMLVISDARGSAESLALLSLGNLGFLDKPFSLHRLGAMVDKALRGETRHKYASS